MVKMMRSPLRVLIADDRPEVRSALRLLLENIDEDWQVVAEATDFSGLKKCVCQQQTDLILLDWELPGFTPDDSSNSEVISQLRNAGLSQIIVACSGLLEARKQAQDAGVDAFISKNDSPERIISLLKSLPLH